MCSFFHSPVSIFCATSIAFICLFPFTLFSFFHCLLSFPSYFHSSFILCILLLLSCLSLPPFIFHFLGLCFLSSFSFCPPPSSCHVSVSFTYTSYSFSFPFPSSFISSFFSYLCPAIHPSHHHFSLSLSCLPSPPPPFFLFLSPKPSTSCLHGPHNLSCASIPFCVPFFATFPLTAGLTTQACSPIRRPSQSGLWCWETSNGQDQRLRTGWDLSVVMETVSPYQFLHVSQVYILLLVFLSTCFVTYWDILILFTLLNFIQLYIKMSYS